MCTFLAKSAVIYGEPINTLHRQGLHRCDESTNQKLHFSVCCGYALILVGKNRDKESSSVLTYNGIKIQCHVSSFAKASAHTILRAACK